MKLRDLILEDFDDYFWKEAFESMREDISASEAYTGLTSVKTLVDGKRDVAFITKGGNSKKDWLEINQIIKDAGLKVMPVKGNPSEAYIIFKPGAEQKATELKDIAEKYGGYLSYKATEEETRRIGQLLSYNEQEIEDYIKKNYKK